MAGQNLAELSFGRWLAGWLASENLAELNFGQKLCLTKHLGYFGVVENLAEKLASEFIVNCNHIR